MERRDGGVGFFGLGSSQHESRVLLQGGSYDPIEALLFTPVVVSLAPLDSTAIQALSECDRAPSLAVECVCH